MLNQSAEYALRVVVRIARLDTHEWAQAADLADELEMPANYLSKLLHQMAAAGVLASRRGRSGGFRLAVPADALTLDVVVEPFDPSGRYKECLLGARRCNAAAACEAHAAWKPVADRLLAFLTTTTVAHLAGQDVPRPRTGQRARQRPRQPSPTRRSRRRMNSAD
ncbi:MAG: hypothetical protein C0503_08215 [Gemmatimonas sp.]|nr:hypothetical protein [Gemmatimonas sp.]